MVTMKKTFKYIAALTLVALITCSTAAVQLQDKVRLKGAEGSTLVGMGIVVGLSGTGDNGKFKPAMRPLASMMRKLIDPSVVDAELANVRNIALVNLTVNIPPTGVREGDKLDIHVDAFGAKSLKGGRLMLTPLLGPIPGQNDTPLAFATGALTVNDEDNLNSAVISKGAQMIFDNYTQTISDDGRITLILNEHDASWVMSNLIATMVNDAISLDGEPIAIAIDEKNVIVQVPKAELKSPSAFISRIMSIEFDPSIIRGEARVIINEKSGTIVWTGNVQISPVIISHKNLTITTITPEPVPTKDQPIADQKNIVGVDPQKKGGASMKDLYDALVQLKVDTSDQIKIIKQLHAARALHAKLIFTH